MAQGETFNSGDFKCTLLEDGSAEIKKYTGKASVLGGIILIVIGLEIFISGLLK